MRINVMRGARLTTSALLAAVCVPLAAVADDADGQVAEVLAVQAASVREEGASRTCWATLKTERQSLAEADQARPWLVRHGATIAGVALGAATGAYLMDAYAKPAWINSVGKAPLVGAAAVGGGVLGGLGGPGATLGFVGGGVLAKSLRRAVPDKIKPLPFIVAGAVGGAALGMVAWDWAFPPAEPVAPESATSVPLDTFVRDERCAELPYQRVADGHSYRVVYAWKGEERTADLSFEPGDAVRVDEAGTVIGPAPRLAYP